MQTRDELIKEMINLSWICTKTAESLYDRIAEVATREMSIRCEEQARVIGEMANTDTHEWCYYCGYYAELRCLRKSDERLKLATCADGVKAYIEARVKERMGKDGK